ncbi:MAG: DNA mismatch repair protein [Piccolia ochrophora]|nr:MAG: DNA mismatch repair protein [Piccolia ochrophora]
MDMELDNEVPRGTKRKADDAHLPIPTSPRRIKALDQDVVNKIAAGEIIVAPVHALKELLENAVDAGATSLEILVKDGGLKLLQITDNGHGIDREDLPILCERFTTSKLKAFEDLMSIGTYGFRGEALASISHIAHLTVTTKTKESSCAWRAHYSDGKLAPAKPGQSAEPKATAGRGGTQITVEDLFYNIPTRRRAFRSSSEEYAKVLDLVGRYAVHCAGVAFSCKKHGDATTGISAAANTTTVDRIRQIHGSAVANEVLEFKTSDDRLGFTAEGWTSNANYHVKRIIFLLFINHRAVESSAIKKAVEQTYSAFLPKGGHPFVYLSLDIDPQRVDVNVHPTKREVNFLNEDEIIEKICDEIRIKLASVDTSRTFMTQSLLPGARNPTSTTADAGSGSPYTGNADRRSSGQKPYENNLVRTDAKMRKITSMLPPGQTSVPNDASDDAEYELTDRVPVICRLTSVRELRAEVRENTHNELTEMFASHTFVGIVDETRRIAAIQGGVKLFLVDYGMVCNEYFYQLALSNFSNLGRLTLTPPPTLESLLTLAATTEEQSASAPGSPSQPAIAWPTVVPKIHAHLLSRRAMLAEYFSLEISEDGLVHSIPLLTKGYTPSLTKLPRFLLRLGPCVDWSSEKACFRSFLIELAAFYTPEVFPPPPPPQGKVDDAPPPNETASPPVVDQETLDTRTETENRRRHVARALENIFFPAFRARLVATKGLTRGVVEVANLKGLYRVFERC